MKRSAILLPSVLLVTSIFSFSPASAAENNSKDLKHASYSSAANSHFSKKQLDKIVDSYSIKYEVNINSKKYLTEEEIRKTNPNMLNEIYQELKSEIDSGKYTEEKLNEIASQKIRSSLGTSKSSTTANSIAANGYEIPGFGTLTNAEVDLAMKHPIEFTKYSACAVEARSEAEKYYWDLTQGNGDAFRHAYWNAILLINLSGASGPVYGSQRAEAWTNAHESNSSGVDKEMDLYNNWVGRLVGYDNYFQTNSTISSKLRGMVDQGSLCRIVNGELVATDGSTRIN